MLNAIAPGVASSASNPVLDFWSQRDVTDASGFAFYGLAVPSALSFQIWDVRNEDAPVQLFPATAGQKQSVHLTNDLVGGIDGHYAAAWTVTAAAPTVKGRHQIRWFHTPTLGASEIVTAYDFDILPAAASIPGAGTAYALVSDLRDEGVTDATDARLLRVLGLQARYIESVTSRSFRPVLKTLAFDGSGGRSCQFGEPLIALVDVVLGQPATTPVGRSSFRVYNRHIASGMIEPDDRQDPKIEFTHSTDLLLGHRSVIAGSPLFGLPWRDHYFPQAVQNVTVRGVWGYTDHDGGPVGVTPALIVKVQKLLVFRDLPTMTGSGADDREDQRSRHLITGERTRDQSYTKQASRETAFTGNREIDDILEMYLPPMRIGSA